MVRWILLLFLGFGGLVSPAAEAPEPDRTIETLLGIVAARSDVVFIRNGSDYNAATAVKFLRGKWDRARAEVKTADDFIVRIATKSSTTGQPYRLRFPDGHEVDCADFLREQLAALRGK
jgi:hypothetical protein